MVFMRSFADSLNGTEINVYKNQLVMNQILLILMCFVITKPIYPLSFTWEINSYTIYEKTYETY